MSIESDLLFFLENTIKEGRNKSRDIQIIKYYYGFGDLIWPTLEETAKRFNIGTRERVRQLLNSKFRNNISSGNIKSVNTFITLLSSRRFWKLNELESHLLETELVIEPFSVKGIFNLIEEMNIENEYEIYTPEIIRSSRSTIEIFEKNFILKKEDAHALIPLLKKIKSLPGRCGIADLKYISKDLEGYYDILIEILSASTNLWMKKSDEHFWYVFENRDNVLINFSEKIYSVISSCNSKKLSIVYENALNARTPSYPYPNKEIIKEYLESSLYFNNDPDDLKFIGKTTKLNDIENDILSFFKSIQITKYPDLRAYLETKNYGAPHIDKAILHSPLIFVDKEAGRTHYTFSLVGDSTLENCSFIPKNRYEEYLLKLREMYDTNTDETIESKMRKEQWILRDWLFGKKEYGHCAICGKKYNIQTLVVAHKKRRADCNNFERLDPNIVMPLCLIGCDYLYENTFIFIKDGIIKKNPKNIKLADEFQLIENLIENKVKDEWLNGPSNYFRKPL